MQPQQRFGHTIEHHLEKVLEALADGSLELWQLSPSLAGMYELGYDHGRESLRPALEDAQHEAAIAYERLHNPGRKFTEMYARRVEQAAELHADVEGATQYYEAVLATATTPRRAAA